MSARRTSVTLLASLALIGSAAALPAAASLAATQAAGTVAHVTIQDFAFRPAVLKIKVGTTVSWTNKDAMAHNVTAADGHWHSGTLNQSQSYAYTFHPGMAARVIVSK